MTRPSPDILLVEDDAALSDAYKTVFASAGYKIRHADDGRQALRLAEEREPDIIFLDIRLPVMDGLEFLRAYRPKTDHPKVKIVVFSNYDMQSEVDEAYRLGAERYVLKAWTSPKELVKIVRDLTRLEKSKG